MPGLRNLFATPQEADPTGDLPRPSSRLGGLSRLTNPVVEASEAASPPAIVEPAQVAPRPRATESVAPSPRRKTSLSLPAPLQRRISQAYHRDRWTMADLVAEALRRTRSGRIQPAAIERRVRSLEGPSSSIKTVALPRNELDELDDLAAQLRLSRSLLVAVLVDLVLDDL